MENGRERVAVVCSEVKLKCKSEMIIFITEVIYLYKTRNEWIEKFRYHHLTISYLSIWSGFNSHFIHQI